MKIILKIVRKNYIYEKLEKLMFMMEKLKLTIIWKSILELTKMKTHTTKKSFQGIKIARRTEVIGAFQ